MEKEQIIKSFKEAQSQALQKSSSKLESVLADTEFSGDIAEDLAKIAKVSVIEFL